MSVTYRSVTLQRASVVGGGAALARKEWGYSGANGVHSMTGGTRGKTWTVSGIATPAQIATYEAWKDGAVGTAVINGTTETNVEVVDVQHGEFFTNAGDSTLYQYYSVTMVQLYT